MVKPEDEATDGRAVDDAAVDAVAFDLSDFDDGFLDDVDVALDEAGVAHGWDDAVTLVVAEADADRAEEIIHGLEYPDELPVEAAADDDLVDVMSQWFVAADGLIRDPGRSQSAAELLATLPVTEGRRAPFGVDPDVWSASRADAEALVSMVADDGDPETIVERARALRDRLRPLV